MREYNVRFLTQSDLPCLHLILFHSGSYIPSLHSFPSIVKKGPTPDNTVVHCIEVDTERGSDKRLMDCAI